jgi:hypothetical protein
MVRLWTWSGHCFGYRDGDNLWTCDGRHVGRFWGDDIYGPGGRYIGQIMSENLLITHKAKKAWQRSSFSPFFRRPSDVGYPERVGHAVFPGYEDFPSL